MITKLSNGIIPLDTSSLDFLCFWNLKYQLNILKRSTKAGIFLKIGYYNIKIADS